MVCCLPGYIGRVGVEAELSGLYPAFPDSSTCYTTPALLRTTLPSQPLEGAKGLWVHLAKLSLALTRLTVFIGSCVRMPLTRSADRRVV